MRNGSPRKKLGACTYSSSGPAMKSGLISTRCGVGRAGSSQASGRDVLPIRKDRRQARGERHQLLHLAIGVQCLRSHFAISRAEPCLLAGVKPDDRRVAWEETLNALFDAEDDHDEKQNASAGRQI